MGQREAWSRQRLKNRPSKGIYATMTSLTMPLKTPCLKKRWWKHIHRFIIYYSHYGGKIITFPIYLAMTFTEEHFKLHKNFNRIMLFQGSHMTRKFQKQRPKFVACLYALRVEEKLGNKNMFYWRARKLEWSRFTSATKTTGHCERRGTMLLVRVSQSLVRSW